MWFFHSARSLTAYVCQMAAFSTCLGMNIKFGAWNSDSSLKFLMKFDLTFENWWNFMKYHKKTWKAHSRESQWRLDWQEDDKWWWSDSLCVKICVHWLEAILRDFMQKDATFLLRKDLSNIIWLLLGASPPSTKKSHTFSTSVQWNGNHVQIGFC